MKGDAAAWDQRYATAEFVWTTDPNRFLPPEVEGLDPGRALDVACGEGRNSVWLATRGWDVTGVDFSSVALEKAARLADENGVEVTWVCGDVTDSVVAGSFDLVIVFYLQLPASERRDALASAARRLAPGGTILIVGHDLTNLTEGVGGPQDPAVLFGAEDISADLDTSGVDDLVVQRAEQVRRPVGTGSEMIEAIDCLVRASRAAD